MVIDLVDDGTQWLEDTKRLLRPATDNRWLLLERAFEPCVDKVFSVVLSEHLNFSSSDFVQDRQWFFR